MQPRSGGEAERTAVRSNPNVSSSSKEDPRRQVRFVGNSAFRGGCPSSASRVGGDVLGEAGFLKRTEHAALRERDEIDRPAAQFLEQRTLVPGDDPVDEPASVVELW